MIGRVLDDNGVPVANRPVLVRGERVFYQDPDNAANVLAFNHVGTGIPIDAYPYIWGMDHNVLAKEEAWGAGDPPDSCNTCHNVATGGVEKPTLNVMMDASKFVEMANGDLDGRKAFLTRKLKVKGNIALAQKMQKFFPQG